LPRPLDEAVEVELVPFFEARGLVLREVRFLRKVSLRQIDGLLQI